ncbi:MAG: hypothetical protein P4M00_18765 [Azospirillaceae bacterium]|nr:hypothetical protein [Azospirillaceae bacterium]
MVGNNENAEPTEADPAITASKAPSKARQKAAPATPPAPSGKISGARAVVQEFFSTEFGAREIRVTRIAPLGHGLEGWVAEAEILVPNLELKTLGLPLTQEVLEREYYAVELDPDLSIRSYGPIGVDDN